MKTDRITYSLLLALCVFATCGDSCFPEQQGSPGFPVSTDDVIVDSAGNIVAGPGPVPGQAVSGTWLSDNSGATGTIYQFAGATDNDGVYMVTNGRIDANWSLQVLWNPPCVEQGSASTIQPVDAFGWDWTCVIEVTSEGPNSSTHFVLPGAVPSTITSYGDFSTTYGEPQLRVYVGGSTPGFVSSVSASSVVPGSSATFPFPTQSNGSALAKGFYSLVNTNVASGGSLVFVDPSYLAVGGITTLQSAFGVDASDVTVTTRICVSSGNGHGGCGGGTGTYAVPALTQYYSNQVDYYTPYTTSPGGLKSATVAVGTQPVAVKVYGTYTTVVSWSTANQSEQVTTTFAPNAIVVNSGSNNVSLVNFQNMTSVNVAVGTQPMAVALNSGATMAYVANFGSGTVSEVNLSTKAVSRTANVGTEPMSVAMDPGGSYVWVGATNYLYKVSLSTFSVVASVPVTGSVTSLAASNAQNELVYTLVQNCCSASSTYAANELLLTNLSTPGTYAQATAIPYAAYTMNGTLPTAAVLPQATNVVSARFSNGMGASSTPTGFVIYDLVSHQQIMTGTTPTPVRGIASDPDSMYAYFTLPDSNEYIAVPLESTP